nr:MAG TPA: hypothetical protein [Caudoviricetes sp.]
MTPPAAAGFVERYNVCSTVSNIPYIFGSGM